MCKGNWVSTFGAVRKLRNFKVFGQKIQFLKTEREMGQMFFGKGDGPNVLYLEIFLATVRKFYCNIALVALVLTGWANSKFC